MSSVLSAELAATCNALGYFDAKTNKYYADSNTLETVKDLVRYLRRDDDNHDIRRQLGETKVLQTDLLPLLKNYWNENDLFDVLLRLLINLTTPALILWNEKPPTDKTSRNYYLQIEGHLANYKQSFSDETIWAVLSARLSKILEIDYAERGEENSLIIERILILIRNILYVPPDPYTEKRPDNDASIHDQVLWALHQSGMLDIILFMASSINEKVYYMHILEILSFMLREQKPSELANAALQRSEMEKIRDEAELLAIRHKETNQKQQKVKNYSGARHSRFGGTYVIKSMKSIGDNNLISYKPLNKIDSLNFDLNKKKPKTPKNRLPIESCTYERRSAFTIRLFLKEFCIEFLNGSYNTFMYHVKDNLVRHKTQEHDDSYYLWALKFYMEFNRCYKFEVKLVSETVSLRTFHYVQQLIDKYSDALHTDKEKSVLWSLRLHLALMAYRELLSTLLSMDKSSDNSVRESANILKSNIFYIMEYREIIVSLLIMYDELKMSSSYLRDLMETQHIFLKMFEHFCKIRGSIVIQKKRNKTKNRKKIAKQIEQEEKLSLDNQWDEISSQLSTIVETGSNIPSDIVPFDAASDVPIDEQKTETMKNVQRKLRSNEFENAVGLLRAAREVWPENDCFGNNNMAPEEEFLALRDIFFADLGEKEASTVQRVEQPIYNDNDEEEDEEDEDREINFIESDIKFEDFIKRFCHPKIVKACGLALKHFDTNTTNTNHCIVKLLHRIAFDCKMYVMVFQVSIFQTFQRIFTNRICPQYKELVKFATYIIRQFMKIAETNNRVYIEALFWKTKAESYDIEFGYGSYNEKSSSATRIWTEQDEDELRRLFMEHQENQLKDDIVDWIVNNLIDNTKTRRAVIKKLKDMHLLVDYKGRKSNNKYTKYWSDDDENQLRELFYQFKDTAVDPLRCIMEHLEQPRSKKSIVDKLLQLGLISDRKEMRKKRTKKSGVTDPDNDSDGSLDADISDDGDDGNDNDGNPTITVQQIATKKTKNRSKQTIFQRIPDSQLTKLLTTIINLEMNEALNWLKESLEDAIEDFESDENNEGIPLVPIMDYAVDAMENSNFQRLLKAFGISEPCDEQETYWRIPGNLDVTTLKQYCLLLQQSLDNELSTNNEQLEDRDLSGDEDGDIFNKLRNFVKSSDTIEDDENGIDHRRIDRIDDRNLAKTSRIIDSDDDDQVNELKRRNKSSSDNDTPKPKRTRIIESDEDD